MDLVSNFKAAVDIWALITIAILIAVNLVMGLFCAVKGGKLELVKLADFLRTRMVPYVGGYLAVAVLAALMPELQPATLAVFAFVAAALLAKIWEQLRYAGMPLPEIPVISRNKEP